MADIKDRAREYLAKNSEYNEVYGEFFVAVDTMTAMIEFAEQETKELKEQIEIDAKQIRALQKQNGELTDKVAELEAQIEKMKVKWHDLEKDPNDLPKNCKTMCICLGDFGSKYQPVPQVCIGYCDSLGWSDYMGSSLYSTVRYWCELPK